MSVSLNFIGEIRISGDITESEFLNAKSWLGYMNIAHKFRYDHQNSDILWQFKGISEPTLDI